MLYSVEDLDGKGGRTYPFLGPHLGVEGFRKTAPRFVTTVTTE